MKRFSLRVPLRSPMTRAGLALLLLSTLLVSGCQTPEISIPAKGAEVSQPGADQLTPAAGPEAPTAAAETAPAALAITRSYPAPSSRDLPPNSAVYVRLNRDLDDARAATARLEIEGVPGRVSLGRQALVFWPAAPLKPLTSYSATLSIPAAGDAGPALEQRWTFRTGSEPVRAQPRQLPTAHGRQALFRYPYLQSHDPRRVNILWATHGSGSSVAQVRAERSDIWLTVPAESTAFPPARTRMTSAFAQHEAALDGLDPSTAYQYQILQDGKYLAAGVPLHTLPDARASSVRFVAFGDSGTEYSEPRAVRDRILARKPDGSSYTPYDFVVGLGDLAYSNGTFAEFEQRFFAQLSGKNGEHQDKLQHNLLASRPFMAVLGNHEYANNEKSVPEGFLQSFSNPAARGAPREDTERYYSFDAGPAHFVAIDSMKFQRRDTTGQREMLEWLERDLAATDRSWKVVFLHHAIFAHGPHGTYGDQVQVEGLRRRLAPLLQRHKVQLVLFGHDHLYQRSKRLRVDDDGRIVRDSDCRVAESSDGIVYVVIGIGGADLHNRKLEPDPCGTPGYNKAVHDYGEGYDFVATRPDGNPVLFDSSERPPREPVRRHGFLHVEVNGGRLLGTAYNVNGEVLDRFEIGR